MCKEMKSVLFRIWRIMKREARRMVSRPLYLFGMVAAPLFSVFFFLSLMGDGLPQDMPVALMDNDNSSTSRRLVRQLDNFRQTKIELRCADFREARQAMQRGEVYGVFVIPENFEQEVTSGRQPKISFYTNNSYLIAGSLLFRDMKMISVLGSASAGKEVRLAKGQTERQAMAELQPISIDAHLVGNPWLNYSVYLCNLILPGILNILVMIMTVFALGSEVKQASAKVLMRMAKGDVLVALLGKMLPHTLLWFVMITFVEVVLYGYMGFPCNSGLLPMLAASYLLVVASQALSVFFFGLLPVMRLSLSAASLLGVLSISISGVSFPVSEMHPVLQAWANVFPLRHFFLLYVDQALNGLSFYYTWSNYVALLLFLFLPFFVMPRLKYVFENQRYIA